MKTEKTQQDADVLTEGTLHVASTRVKKGKLDEPTILKKSITRRLYHTVNGGRVNVQMNKLDQ